MWLNVLNLALNRQEGTGFFRYERVIPRCHVTKLTPGSATSRSSANIAGRSAALTNRPVPCSWKPVEDSADQEGYLRVFTEAFLHSAKRDVSLKESVCYQVSSNSGYFTTAFDRMRREVSAAYLYKYGLLRNQLSISVHEATQVPPPSAITAAERITNLFLRLLDAQFPVAPQLYEPIVKNAHEYTDCLSFEYVTYFNSFFKTHSGTTPPAFHKA